LSSKKTVTSRFAYQAESASSGQRVLSAVERSISLQLPKTLNLRTQEWARMLREQSADDERFITNVLTYLREQPFYYSLDAPLLGRDSVDEFLFSTRKGFCEHYASSVAFALRAAGVPARVVVGYLGAEANGDYFLVHQYDAHAWVEAWIEGDGWVMVDPTAAVAPERIERGMSAWVDTGDGVLSGSGANFWARRYPLIGKMRLLFDQVDYQWQRWVMGYDAERQTDTLVNLLGEITPARVAALMMGVLGLALGGVVLSLWGREWLRARDPLTQAYEDFCAALARQGVPRAVGEAAGDYAARAAERRPDLAQRIRSVTTLYESLAYRRHTDAQYHNGIRLLRAEVRRFVRESLFSKAPVRKQHNNEGNH
jgi:hypothetical protein